MVTINSYRKETLSSSYWPDRAYQILPGARSLMTCGALCSANTQARCSGFSWEDGSRDCYLLDLKVDDETLVASATQEMTALVEYGKYQL